MVQVTLGKVTADRRPSRRALRPLLLLGGFAALWWILMTGSAQAASGPDQPQVRDTVHAVTGAVHHGSPAAKHPVRRVEHTTRTRAPQVASAVRRHTSPVLQQVQRVSAPVKSAVAKTPVAPVVKVATTSIRKTVHAASKVVPTAPVVPMTKPVHEVVTQTLTSTESSTETGETVSALRGEAVTGSLPTSLLSTLVTGTSGTTSEPSFLGRSDATKSPRPQTPAQGPFNSPTSSERCPSSSATGSAAPTPAGIDEASFSVSPSAGADRHPGSRAMRSGGPSHLPGCSPD